MKTQLKIRTEYSFRNVYGPIDKVAERLKVLGCRKAAITDRNSTFGHVAWSKSCKKAGITPMFGVELSFTPDITVKERRQNILWATVIAKTQAGLKEIYAAIEEATSNFYQIPRLPTNYIKVFSSDTVVILNGNWKSHRIANGSKEFCELNPYTHSIDGVTGVPTSDNFMIEATDRPVYEMITGRFANNRPSPMHILDEWDLKSELTNLTDDDFSVADRIASECNATLEKATNVKYHSNITLFDACLLGAQERGLDMNDIYMKRLLQETKTISERNFDDYLFLVADLVSFAKRNMLVGPARGSSCGSLVCYLLGITDIDPIPHKLVFERFIDVTRVDLPDIDIDFQDNKREMVFDYLSEKYGDDCVGRLGTISRYKAKSAIGAAASSLKIPPWELKDLKRSMIERSGGDSRAAFCILDTFTEVDVGRDFLRRYPAMAVSARMEAHARHTGKHAAGVVITEKPLIHYVAKDLRTNTIHIDKYDAEVLNLLKIDALGLNTLTIIADCIEQVGWKHENLLHYPLEDDSVFEVLRNQQWCGIFQFEGPTLQMIARQIHVDQFNDLVAITTLSRPGPLASGAASEWSQRRMNRKPVEYIHESTRKYTEESHGLIIYQEQVLLIAREIGQMNWDDVTILRKAISKSMGVEFFNQFWEKFRVGALQNGLEETTARKIWDTMNTFGSWAFNKSHSVAYGMLSYWCCVLKSKFPLEFALATLRHSKDHFSVIRYLRELDRSGRPLKVFDPEHSVKDWSIKDGMLLGGLLNVKGIGPRTADAIMERRARDEIRYETKMINPITPYDNIFEARNKFPKLLAEPAKFGINSKMTELFDVNDEGGRYVFIAKILERNIRSLNEKMYLVKRNNMKVPTAEWLNLLLEDDTDTIRAIISRFEYNRLGLPLVNKYQNGDWFIWKGIIKPGHRFFHVERYKFISAENSLVTTTSKG